MVAHDRRQGNEGKGATDAVDDEPTETRRQPAESGRKEVPKETERRAAFNHLRHAEPRAHRRNDVMSDRTKKAPQNDTEDGRPESPAEDGDRKYADEDGREFHVGRHPGPEKPDRTPMPLTIRDVLDAARLDGSDL